jgi:hypothetical protein
LYFKIKFPEITSNLSQNLKAKPMNSSPEHDARMAKMTFAEVYPQYMTKVERKGRTKEELHEVIA